jgi:hypothetical protein
MDSEVIKVLHDLAKLDFDAVLDEEVMGFFGVLQPFVPILLFDAFGDLDEVYAMVVIITKVERLTEELVVTGSHGVAKVLDLVAAVVEIVFTGNFVSGFGEDVADAVAKSGTPGVA